MQFLRTLFSKLFRKKSWLDTVDSGKQLDRDELSRLNDR